MSLSRVVLTVLWRHFVRFIFQQDFIFWCALEGTVSKTFLNLYEIKYMYVYSFFPELEMSRLAKLRQPVRGQ